MTPSEVEGRVQELTASVGAEMFVHARDIATGREVGVGSDVVLPAASLFKIAVLVALAADAHEGRLELTEQVAVSPTDHVRGPTGLSAFADPASLSVRDLALLMMSVSDNTAADLLLAHIGRDRLNARMADLNLTDTRIIASCRELTDTIVEELGAAGVDLTMPLSGVPLEVLRRLSALDPARTNRTTPREMTRLLSSVWAGTVLPPEPMALVRQLMSAQVFLHRIPSGLPGGWEWFGKTGTLPGLRHEAGVACADDGQAIAVTVLTRAHDFQEHRPDIDQAIGHVAAAALGALTTSLDGDVDRARAS